MDNGRPPGGARMRGSLRGDGDIAVSDPQSTVDNADISCDAGEPSRPGRAQSIQPIRQLFASGPQMELARGAPDWGACGLVSRRSAAPRPWAAPI
jgi:hypothetical protein